VLSQHRRAVWVGVTAIVLMGLFPPWRYEVVEGGSVLTVPDGYAPLFSPPREIARIRAFSTIAETARAARLVENAERNPPANPAAAALIRDLQLRYAPQIDYQRLFLQSGLVVLVIGTWIAVGPFARDLRVVDRLNQPLTVRDLLIVLVGLVGVFVLHLVYPALRVPWLGITVLLWYWRKSR
jgi:hypothetical protein